MRCFLPMGPVGETGFEPLWERFEASNDVFWG